MLKALNTAKWYDNLWAALIVFTRIPFKRLYEPPRMAYQSAIEYWPLTGWLIGGVMALTLYVGAQFLPYYVTIATAIAARELLTGGKYEKQLGLFVEGFYWGRDNRSRIFEAQSKPSPHLIGAIGMGVHLVLLYAVLVCMPLALAVVTVFAAIPYAQMVTSQLVIMMPHARPSANSTSIAFRKISASGCIGLAVQGLLPLVALFYFQTGSISWETLIFFPCLVMYLMYLLVWRKLGGYNATCCGAVFLFVELTCYLAVAYQ